MKLLGIRLTLYFAKPSVRRAEALAGVRCQAKVHHDSNKTSSHDVSRTFGLNGAISFVNGRLQLKRPTSAC